MRPTILLVLLLASTLGAGCTREPVNPYEPPTDGETGNLRVVVQAGRERVPNASVIAMPWGAFGTTDEQGIAVLRGLAPGVGNVTVDAEGYYDRRVSAQVLVGETVEVPVILDRARVSTMAGKA